MRHVATLAVLLAACSRTPSPKDPTEHALFRDLERQVTVAETPGWGIDRIEIDLLLEPALDSVCRVDVLGRRSLREWLDAEISRQGGPVDEAWRARGKKLSRVKDLLILHRVRMLLERAEASSLDCPFWLEPENPFRGRQISEHTWQLTGGGGGKASAIQRGDQQDLSVGAAGRVLFGRTWSEGDGLYVGLEVGASGQFPKDEMGERTTLTLGVDVVTPIVYRRTFTTNTYGEVEVGWLGHSTETDWTAIDHGVHVGFAYGGRALRQRFLFPGAAIGIGFERLFVRRRSGEDATSGDDVLTVKLGARFVIDLDL